MIDFVQDYRLDYIFDCYDSIIPCLIIVLWTDSFEYEVGSSWTNVNVSITKKLHTLRKWCLRTCLNLYIPIRTVEFSPANQDNKFRVEIQFSKGRASLFVSMVYDSSGLKFMGISTVSIEWKIRLGYTDLFYCHATENTSLHFGSVSFVQDRSICWQLLPSVFLNFLFFRVHLQKLGRTTPVGDQSRTKRPFTREQDAIISASGILFWQRDKNVVFFNDNAREVGLSSQRGNPLFRNHMKRSAFQGIFCHDPQFFFLNFNVKFSLRTFSFSEPSAYLPRSSSKTSGRSDILETRSLEDHRNCGSILQSSVSMYRKKKTTNEKRDEEELTLYSLSQQRIHTSSEREFKWWKEDTERGSCP